MFDKTKQVHLFIVLALMLTTLAVYWQVMDYDFTNYDDELYVTQNRWVQAGMTLEGVAWAFRTLDVSNWHPATWLSHMVISEFFGLNPLWHHLANLALHLASILLLFHVFQKMTGDPWQSGFVAALFALHPLNVESVAWVAERKGVLCTFFWMLTLWSYLRYIERPRVGRYCWILLFFILGGMAKPMIVTLPFVLLLLDYWPLERFKTFKTNDGQVVKMGLLKYGPVKEKIPLFLIVAFIAVAGFVAQQSGGALSNLETLPLGTRVSNAVVSYVLYLWKAIWPSGLTVFYPHYSIPVWQLAVSSIFLLLVSLGVILARHGRPYLAVGWFWYLGTFVPVIQLVQVGRHFTADRYAYIPLVGIFVMAVWGISDLLKSFRGMKMVLAFSSMGCLIVLGVLTWRQAGYWSDSKRLFEHGLQVVSHNYVAHNGLARALEAEGKTDEAVRHFEEALRIRPGFTDGRYNLARILAAEGKQREAVQYYLEVLEDRPDYVRAHINLANILTEQGRLNEAMGHYNEALALKKESVNAHYNLANTLLRAGRTDEAIEHYLKALNIRPDAPDINYNLGNAFMMKGDTGKAIYYYSKSLRFRPDFVNARVNLGNAFAKTGKSKKAILQYRAALRLQKDHAGAHYNLASTLSIQGKTDEAITHYEEALRLRPEDAHAQFQLGAVLTNSGKDHEAMMHYLEALRIRPDFVEAHMALGDALATRGKTPEAVEHYREAMRINPAAKPLVYYNMACMYALENRVEESIECLRKAVKSGFYDWDHLKTDKDLENIRNSTLYVDFISGR